MYLCAAFPGWSVEYVEASLDAPRLQQLTRHLSDNPPVWLLVKWFVGYEPPPSLPQTEPERLDAFVQAFRDAVHAAS